LSWHREAILARKTHTRLCSCWQVLSHGRVDLGEFGFDTLTDAFMQTLADTP